MANDLVLLTGATGFIGFRTLILLLEAGYKVRAAVRNAIGSEKIKAIKPIAQYESQIEYIIVPDITISGAYDDAVKGVKYVVHMASPFASPDLQESEFESNYIQPAIKGSTGILDSAATVQGIERIVITGSYLSIAGFAVAGTDAAVDETHRSAVTVGPYPNWLAAYAASKALAFEATKEWMAKHKPSFDLITIEPVFVLGRDDTATKPDDLFRGPNVHVDDVALMHVRSLDPAIPGNEDYLSNSHSLENMEWEQSFDIIKKHYPKECAEGIFKVDTTERPKTLKVRVDSTKAEKTFGITFKSFEEQVLSIAGQYLELIGRK
ncbi:ketoreductase CTB6 [Trichoderma asperellum]|uniref:Ketoreductase CTB6 n=1 Tax=Trichoderma asperellum TaxID=101201 RepID=A0A6V8R4P3_TRIAP|nr:ketoreductase CTB6 [Trichoderma asperellum]